MYVEGKAKIRKGKAFLNPRAKFLRDVSVAFVACNASRGSRILDATAGTGIRGIRYYLETKSKKVTMLDMNRSAFRSVVDNVLANKVKADVAFTSIQEFTNTTKGNFDFIDVDPFGGIGPYVYDIMKVVRDGTFLMLTSTDGAVLCGAHPSACMKIYGSVPMHNELCQEAGIRIMINFVAGIAAQFNFGVEVLLSIWDAHYLRVFLRLRHGSNAALSSLKKTGYLHYCRKCGFRSWETGFVAKEYKCSECGSGMETAGKLWLGNMYDKEEVKRLLSYLKEKQGSSKELELINDEYDVPFFYSIPVMTKRMRSMSVSPYKVVERLREKGYQATKTQFDPSGVKTNADIGKIKECIT